MIRRPPRSTLFPTRRSSDLRAVLAGPAVRVAARKDGHAVLRPFAQVADGAVDDRSEEHTSELQSHLNLVCRLLLEKKKKNPTVRVIVAGSTCIHPHHASHLY